ncbi:ArsA family ATPase [Fictibacillus nanhaiensis]|uniref:ArsA family ATPase n=1 Tax=Fictibacillus nanhaiensis TaxID=742169 RepID=UPI001C98834D|nr:ArsA family ATPase [Fictibacillus nanhaiensis]MBY6037805.1 ArsA family ATPase [Fictibacillus nanhaiensis]
MKVFFIGGKGGVGKSTTASAFAVLCAREGKKTLLVSTDPAHNTGDLFQVKKVRGKTKIAPNLDLVEIDSDQEAITYMAQVKQNIKGLVKVTMVEEVYRQLDLAGKSPGAAEAAVFDKMTSILLEDSQEYDRIIFDTAPTGHTLRLLLLPEFMGVWMDGLLEKRKKVQDNYSQLLYDGETREDPIYEVLQARRQKFSKVRELIINKEKTTYMMVLNPERLPILETASAVKTLKEHGISVSRLIVNKVIPEDVEGTFMRNRKEAERPYLIEIDQMFNETEKIYVPMFDHDISTREGLEEYSRYLESEKLQNV